MNIVDSSERRPDDGARAVAEALPAWGPFRVIRPLPGGNRADVFLVARERSGEVARDDVGALFVAKTTTRDPDSVAWAAAVAQQARSVGLAASGYLSTPEGRWVVGGVTLQPFIDSRPATVAQRRAALPCLRAFHAATAGTRQRPRFASCAALLHRRCGGDVDLDAMPAGLVRLCRAAWRPLQGRPRAAIHGDLNADNVISDESGRMVLLDWDECRVDATSFDELAWLEEDDRSEATEADRPHAEARPSGAAAAMAEGERELASRASLAWEVAACWTIEPHHARRLARILGWHGD